jgi:hypothetical protein
VEDHSIQIGTVMSGVFTALSSIIRKFPKGAVTQILEQGDSKLFALGP